MADTTGPTLTCRPLTLPKGMSGRVVADVADTQSGPVTPTVSATVRGRVPGTLTVGLTAYDKAGNSTTAQCPYSVTKATVSGPTAVTSGQRRTYTASGLPASSGTTWTLRRKVTTVRTVRKRTAVAGTSSARFRFPDPGRYTVRVNAEGVEALLVVKAG